MGNICSCDDDAHHIPTSTIMDQKRDPAISDLLTHLKHVDDKLKSNLVSIDDFLHLLNHSKPSGDE